MKKIVGTFILDGDELSFQKASYIEDGWFIELKDSSFYLWEIPIGGGKPIYIGAYWDLRSAIKAGEQLT